MKWLVMVEEVEEVVMDEVEAAEVVEDSQVLTQRPWVEAAVGSYSRPLNLPRTI